jgi:hypothetical protein
MTLTLHLLTTSVASRQLNASAGGQLADPVTGRQPLLSLSAGQLRPNARPAFEIQPRSPIKIKRITPFF